MKQAKQKIQRNNTGQYRRKRSDTKMETIERKYGKDFSIRGDMKLKTFLEQKGYNSLSKILKDDSKQKYKSKR